MTSRSAILNRISNAHDRAGKTAPLPDAKPVMHSPNGSRAVTAELQKTFTQRLKGNGIITTVCRDAADVPTCIADLANTARDHSQRICVAPHAGLQDLDWQTVGAGDVHFGRWQTGDTIAVSHAPLAIAESGSLVLASGADTPTGLAFLPDHHIIVVKCSSLVATLTDAMARIGEWTRAGSTVLPRAINIISGASRTADIGGKIVHGAHGPSKLCVVIYDNA